MKWDSSGWAAQFCCFGEPVPTQTLLLSGISGKVATLKPVVIPPAKNTAVSPLKPAISGKVAGLKGLASKVTLTHVKHCKMDKCPQLWKAFQAGKLVEGDFRGGQSGTKLPAGSSGIVGPKVAGNLPEGDYNGTSSGKPSNDDIPF